MKIVGTERAPSIQWRNSQYMEDANGKPVVMTVVFVNVDGEQTAYVSIEDRQ